MVKTPKTRHSRPQKEPMTIELGPDAVSRVTEAEKSAEESATVFETAADAASEQHRDAQSETSEPSDAPSLESRAADDAAPTQDPTDRLLGSEWPPEQASARPDGASWEPDGASRKSDTDDEPFGRPGDTNTAAAGGGGPAFPAASASPAPRRGGALVGGLAGGAIVLAAVGLLQVAGFWPDGGAATGETGVAALQADVEALKQDLAALKSVPGVDVSALERALADSVARTDSVASGLDALRSDVDALKSAVQSGGAGDGPALEALAARIAKVESTVAALGEGTGGANPAELTALADRIGGVEAALQSARDAAVVDSGRLADVEQGVSDLRSRIDTLGTRLETLGDQPRIALALTAAALRAALDRGGPFPSEVETFAAVAPDAPEIAELRRIAAEGVATRQALATQMEETAGAMIAAGEVVDENAGFFVRLWASAQSLVTVRPVGPVEGEGVPETVARMEQAVKDGNFAGAVAEYETLPDAVKLAGAELADRIRGRLAAEQLIDKALADALKAA